VLQWHGRAARTGSESGTKRGKRRGNQGSRFKDFDDKSDYKYFFF
jgi:hypothetical protein